MAFLMFNEHDFDDLVAVEIVENTCVPADPTSVVVPGSAGRALCRSEVGVRVVRVRLKLLVGVGLDDAKRKISGWLSASGGCPLAFEDGLVCNSAVCTSFSPWTRIRGEETCEVEFTCFNPLMYGMPKTATSTTFEVGGNWRYAPRVIVSVPSAADSVTVLHVGSGKFVRVVRTFAGGEKVSVDCSSRSVTVDGVKDEASVDIMSDYFELTPGSNTLQLNGCALVRVDFRETWI